MRLEGKVALISGAASGVEGDLMGFGGAARLFAREGAKVVLTDINQESVSRGLLIGLAVSGVCLWLAARKVDGPAFVAAIEGVDPGPVVLAFLLTPIACLMRVLRWRVLFTFDDARETIFVLRVLPRSRAYRR